MGSYQALGKALSDSVQLYAPEIIYPRGCLITKVNTNTVDVLTIIGGEVTLHGVDYIGNPVVGDEAVLIPLNNNFNTSIVICKVYNNTIKEEITVNDITDTSNFITSDDIKNIIEEMDINYENYNMFKQEMEAYKQYIEEERLRDKEELLNEIEQKADKVHTHTFKEIFIDTDEIPYIDINEF